MQDRDGYVIGGDGLRAIASIAVLLFHAYVATVLAAGGAAAADPGSAYAPFGAVFVHLALGLFVFFALSGYLVGGPYVRAWVRGTDPPVWRPYLERRLRRIVPAFWLVTGLLLLRFGTIGSDATEVVSLLLFNQNMTQGGVQRLMPQGWTLNVELAFYLALPLLAVLAAHLPRPATPQARLRVLLAALVGATLVSLVLRVLADPAEFAGRNLVVLLFAFVPGLVLAAGEEQWRPSLQGRRGRRVAGGGLVVALAATVLTIALDTRDGEALREIAHLAVGGGLLVWVVVWQWATGGAPGGFTARPVLALGRWSYGIYLVHVGIGLELLARRPADLDGWGLLAYVCGGMLVLSIVAAALLWRFVEAPILRHGASARRRREMRDTGPHAPEAVG